MRQAIKDEQAVIVSVGQEIKATEKELFVAKLSPLSERILSKKFGSLLDKEQALMDEEKTLMDKEQDFTISSAQESTPNPFEFSIPCEELNFPDSDGGKVIFKREWLVKDVADMVLTKYKDGKYNSYYWRAPMGSGKTVFLKLIGQELQDRGCVLHLVFGAEMENFKQKYFHQLAQNAGDKIVVLLIDEVHNNVFSKHWNDLLRSGRPRNLLVLGVGIPPLTLPLFMRRFPRENELFPMFLTSKDIPEVAAFFSKDSSHSKEVVTKLCDQVLVFTNGHFFPFAKIMEHVLSTEIEADLSDISLYLSSQEFRTSELYKSIKERCLILSDVLDSATLHK